MSWNIFGFRTSTFPRLDLGDLHLVIGGLYVEKAQRCVQLGTLRKCAAKVVTMMLKAK